MPTEYGSEIIHQTDANQRNARKYNGTNHSGINQNLKDVQFGFSEQDIIDKNFTVRKPGSFQYGKIEQISVTPKYTRVHG